MQSRHNARIPVHADVFAQTPTHRDHTIAFLVMLMEEAAETELDESEGMASGAESEKADDLAESLQWYASSSPAFAYGSRAASASVGHISSKCTT